MQKFSKDSICCDTTHGTTGYDFKLTTLIVIDEFREGVPVAFCLSNRETYEFMKIFFRKVKDSCGISSPTWFMSDTAIQFYEAFAAVNECSPAQLICIWHVDKAWRDELRQKISDVEIQGEVYKYLRTAMEQTDRILFEDYLGELMRRLEMSSATQEFAAYLKKVWLSKKSQLGYTYRVYFGINTNMFCEAFHRVFKYNYLKGKVNKRVDRCLLNLTKFTRDKVFERICKLTKGKNSSRIKRIHSSHQASFLINFSHVQKTEQNGKWMVKSEDGKRMYDVSDSSNITCQCRMVCVECKICSHRFTCQCSDYLIYMNMCKHIHLVCRYKARNCESEQKDMKKNEEVENRIDEDEVLNNYGKEISTLSGFVANKENDDSFNELKKKTEGAVMELLAEIESSTEFDREALQETYKNITKAKNVLVSLKKNKSVQAIEVKLKSPPNKNIEKQRRFYSTKKKQKERKVRLAKPSIDEKSSMFIEGTDWYDSLGGKSTETSAVPVEEC